MKNIPIYILIVICGSAITWLWFSTKPADVLVPVLSSQQALIENKQDIITFKDEIAALRSDVQRIAEELENQ